jgi:hypothetical protein
MMMMMMMVVVVVVRIPYIRMGSPRTSAHHIGLHSYSSPASLKTSFHLHRDAADTMHSRHTHEARRTGASTGTAGRAAPAPSSQPGDGEYGSGHHAIRRGSVAKHTASLPSAACE